MALIANYVGPRQQICDLTRSNCELRAAFIEGGENFGKSHLLASLTPAIVPPERFCIINLDKRRDVPTPMVVLTEIVGTIGWSYFPKFDAAQREIQNAQRNTATVSNVTIHGSYNNVQAIAQESEEDRLIIAMRATDAFASDLGLLPNNLHPLVLAFDGYDAATSLIDRWFDRSLVPRLCEVAHLRLIVSGRTVPHTTVKARTRAAPFVELLLTGVNDEKEWLPIVTALKRRIPGEGVEQIGFLRGIIAAFKGAPGAIMPIILSLNSDT
jgi:hypothetical protein